MKLHTSWLAALVLAASAVPVVHSAPVAATDSLRDWNDGRAKRAIVGFVQTTTDPSSSRFVPPAERIAVFDQDGTLWVERPIYAQLVYCLDRSSTCALTATGLISLPSADRTLYACTRSGRTASHGRTPLLATRAAIARCWSTRVPEAERVLRCWCCTTTGSVSMPTVRHRGSPTPRSDASRKSSMTMQRRTAGSSSA